MELQLAATSLHWSQPSVPHSPSSSAVSSPSSQRRSFSGGDGALFCNYSDRSVLLCGGRRFSKLHRSQSCELPKTRSIRRASSSSFDSFSDEEFAKSIEELSLGFDDEDYIEENESVETPEIEPEAKFHDHQKPFDVLETPEFPERVEIIPANIEKKANSVEIPFSLRIIRRKKQWQEGLIQAGESTYCSVKKAFSSMVFIIRELHRFTIEMREILFYEDLQGILANVQKEIHASFVWLFQKVFSHTPTLMVYVMILLANYGVYSMSNEVTPVWAASYTVSVEEICTKEDQRFTSQKFDPLSHSSGKTSSIGGEDGGGGKFRPLSSNTDGDDHFDESSNLNTITPIEEEKLWKSYIEEASKMQGGSRDESLNQFVSPVDAKIGESESDYFRTDLVYQMELAREPDNPLLLANYAQFLYLVAQDFDRSEDYFKRATKIEPKDAEALNKYANFLWKIRKDLQTAEEIFLEAIDAEPKNSFYAADYAHFLWSTGGEDTCYPLS